MTRKTVDNTASHAGRGSRGTISDDALSRLRFKLQASEPAGKFQSEIGDNQNAQSDGRKSSQADEGKHSYQADEGKHS